MTTEPETPANHIDVDSDEAQNFLEAAFNEARGNKSPVVPEPVTPVEEVVPPAAAEGTTEVEAASPKAKEEGKDPAPTAKDVEGLPEWVKALDPEAQTKVLNVLHDAQYHQQKWRSDVGRQSALQLKLTEARRELANLRNQVSRPQDPALAAATKDDQAKTLVEWNQLIEADPNLAQAIELRIKAESSKLKAEAKAELDANVDPLYQHTRQAYVEDQQHLLQEAVPNVNEVINSPVYKYWYANMAAPGVRHLADTSTDAADAINVLKMYANDAPAIYNMMVENGQLPRPQAPSTPQAQPAGQGSDTALADKVARNREQKVLGAPVIPTAPSVAPTTSMATTLAHSKPGQSIDLDDPYVQKAMEAAFNKFSRR